MAGAGRPGLPALTLEERRARQRACQRKLAARQANERSARLEAVNQWRAASGVDDQLAAAEIDRQEMSAALRRFNASFSRLLRRNTSLDEDRVRACINMLVDATSTLGVSARLLSRMERIESELKSRRAAEQHERPRATEEAA